MIQELKKYFNIKNPTFQFSVFLLLFLLSSFIDVMIYETTPGLRLNYVLSLLSVFFVSEGFWIWNYYSKKIPNLNYLHLGITASIIYLLIHPTAPWWIYAIATALAIMFKSLFRYKGQPIFNPAALGVLMAYLVSLPLAANGLLKYPAYESWWGADLNFSFANQIPVLWILPIIFMILLFYFAKRFKKLVHAITYFVTYILIYIGYALLIKNTQLNFAEFALGTITSSYIFLAFVMVTEPKTSPILKDQQLVLGVLGGFVVFVCSNLIPDIAPQLKIFTYTSSALLILNAITFITKNNASLFGPKKIKPVAVPPAEYVGVVKVKPSKEVNPPQSNV